jgi:cysteine desulfurase
VEKMMEILQDNFGNPSSSHQAGLKAAAAVKLAREQVARSLGALPEEIVFTSSGTEADNLALFGAAAVKCRQGKHIISTMGEHPAVSRALDRLETLGYEVTRIPLLPGGQPDMACLKKSIRKDTILVSIMLVNNELGNIYPVGEVARLLKDEKSRALLHCDGVQAFGKMSFSLRRLGVDLFSVSAHKIHGPKGIGALYIRKGVSILPHTYGGGQEKNLRSGTENTPAIVGFGEAAREMSSHQQDFLEKIGALRQYTVDRLKEKVPNIVFNSPEEDTIPHILSVSLPGLKSEVLLNFLDDKGICVSATSACASKKKAKSSILTNAGFPEKIVDSTLRISFGNFNTQTDCDSLANALYEASSTLLSVF